MEGISIISREIKIIHSFQEKKCKQINILELAPIDKSYTMDNIVTIIFDLLTIKLFLILKINRHSKENIILNFKE